MQKRLTLYAEAPTNCQKIRATWTKKSSGGARTAMKQNTSALHAVLYLHLNAIPELFEKRESSSKGRDPPVSMISTSEDRAHK